MLRRPIVLVSLGATMLAALSGCNSGGTGSPSAGPTTTWVDHAYLVSTLTMDAATESSANTNYLTAFNAVAADISYEEQKLTLDNNTIQAIGFGPSCDGGSAAAYLRCVQSNKTAAYARRDAATAAAKVQADFQHSASSASTLQSALGTFIGQVAGLPWPSTCNAYVTNTVTAARTLRTDVSLQEAELASTAQSSVAPNGSRAGKDVRTFNEALSALKAALPNGGCVANGGRREAGGTT
jgi:hypothetical protein